MDAQQNQPRDHHYTPVFYLSAWSADGSRICVVQNFDSRIDFQMRSPRSTGFERDLYSLSDSAPSEWRTSLETDFFQHLDSLGSEVIRKLTSGTSLTARERNLWAQFVTFMHIRRPDNMSIVRTTGQDAFRAAFADQDDQWSLLREPGDPDTLMEWVEQQMPGIAENFGLYALPSTAQGVARKIFGMVWFPLDFDRTGIQLLCSDAPCVLTAGIDDPNCIVGIPLGPKNAFIAFHRGSPAGATLMRHGPGTIARALNRNVVSQAGRRAYSSRWTDAPESFYRRHLRPVQTRPR